jgi:Cu(I)/Ag(I) efflux system membrane protein CusA/SilA
MFNKFIKFFLENKLVTIILLTIFIVWGIISAPFGWNTGILPGSPVPVDAIPDLGENQQIIYTEWAGQSPQDIEDQISYPLSSALLGVPGVKTIRSNSIFGVSSIYLIFDEDVDFYWSRSRILEKLNSLPSGTLPEGVTPELGPDATALGQVYWYTLEGRDEENNPAGGWDPQELRSIQDFYIKYALATSSGVAEVSSVGGFVKEYQIDIDPAAMKAYNVSVSEIMHAVTNSNLDIGARTIEFNRVEYLVRAIGYVKNLDDLKKTVVVSRDNVPVTLSDVAKISFGPASRRGGLDKGGVEAVGGVVVARYGANPMEVINNVKEKIQEISPGLPSKTLDDGTLSKVTIVSFYDRSGLIKETLGTLEEALSLELLISIIVVIVLMLNLRGSILISGLLPLGVLMTFIIMRQFNVDANIVALSGIAIAIGVMVDVGIVFTENIVRHLDLNSGDKEKSLLNVIYEATIEVAPAVVTAIFTTIISFLPVFALEAAEGKLFRPLAFTKTFAMVSALLIGIMIIPTVAHLIFSIKINKSKIRKGFNILIITAGFIFVIFFKLFIAIALIAIGINNLFEDKWSDRRKSFTNYLNIAIALAVTVYFLSKAWMPIGAGRSLFSNILFVVIFIAAILIAMMGIIKFYPKILKWCLANKWKFLSLPIALVLFGIITWQGFEKVFGFLPSGIKSSTAYHNVSMAFPGIGKEFMPALDEGSFLLMPTTMPHSGVEENLEVIKLLDKRINTIPEVESVVGKWGRVNSALDPAPISMFENIINYKPEYIINEDGKRLTFKTNRGGAFVLKDESTYNPETDEFRRVDKEDLVQDSKGKYFRQWRKNIKTTDDIWSEILKNSEIPGLTSAPKLQPIQTRLVMLQTGMRAPMGIKIYGPDLETIEDFGFQIENLMKEVKGVSSGSVFADRVVGKPYLEIKINREAIARYGISIKKLQSVLGSAVGGLKLTTSLEGRERYAIRVRYAREYRDSPEELKNILIPTPSGAQIPLGTIANIEYSRGPQMIKSENTFLVSYVIFDKLDNFAEVDVVENAKDFLNTKISSGELVVPAGVNYVFTGNYENELRATKKLMMIIPLSLIVIFLILYFQFRSVIASGLIFSGIIVAFSGGFILLWLYGQPWFMNFSPFDFSFRNLFQIHTINLSVAVWVGFIALFGIATDDGALISTYLKQLFDKKTPETIDEVRQTVLEAGLKRVRPAMMTTSTTIIAFLPVLTSTGKGSDIMVPMAIPIFGGMSIAILTIFVVPVLYSMWKENSVKKALKKLKS